MNFQSLLKKYRYFNTNANTNANPNTNKNVPSISLIKPELNYVMPIINTNTNTNTNINTKTKSLSTILNIDTNLNYDYEKQITEEKESVNFSSYEDKNNINAKYKKYKYITLFLVSTLIVFPIYKYIFIYK
jgi:hypothetical protein